MLCVPIDHDPARGTGMKTQDRRQPNAATPNGKDTIGRLEERNQRDAEERSRQAVENQGAQGRKPDPAPGAPTGSRPRK
jgi:hypothetical protein